jgi:hypothetical protein
LLDGYLVAQPLNGCRRKLPPTEGDHQSQLSSGRELKVFPVLTRFEDRKPFQWVAYLNLLSVPFVQEGLGLLTRVRTVTRKPLSIAVREMDDQDRWISRALDPGWKKACGRESTKRLVRCIRNSVMVVVASFKLLRRN